MLSEGQRGNGQCGQEKEEKNLLPLEQICIPQAFLSVLSGDSSIIHIIVQFSIEDDPKKLLIQLRFTAVTCSHRLGWDKSVRQVSTWRRINGINICVYQLWKLEGDFKQEHKFPPISSAENFLDQRFFGLSSLRFICIF